MIIKNTPFKHYLVSPKKPWPVVNLSGCPVVSATLRWWIVGWFVCWRVWSPGQSLGFFVMLHTCPLAGWTLFGWVVHVRKYFPHLSVIWECENAHFWPASSQFVSSYADLCQSESKTGNILVYPQLGNTHPVYWLLHQKPVSCCKMKDYLRFVWKCLNRYPHMPGPKVSLTNMLTG